MCLQLEVLNLQPQSLSRFLLGPGRISLTPKKTWPIRMRLGHLSEHLLGCLDPLFSAEQVAKRNLGD